MVSIRKFRIFVLVSNRIEYWSNYSIRFKYSHITSNFSNNQTEGRLLFPFYWIHSYWQAHTYRQLMIFYIHAGQLAVLRNLHLHPWSLKAGYTNKT